MARPPATLAVCRSCHKTLWTGSSKSDGTSSGRMAVRSDSSAMRAERFDDRTAENVATARTSVPPAVANEAIELQSAITTNHIERGRGLPGQLHGKSDSDLFS